MKKKKKEIFTSHMKQRTIFSFFPSSGSLDYFKVFKVFLKYFKVEAILNWAGRQRIKTLSNISKSKAGF